MSKKFLGYIILSVFALISICASLNALTFDGVKSAQGDKLQSALESSFQSQQQDNPSASIEIPELTDADFEKEVLQYKGAVLLDFWFEGCVPCRIILPKVKELAAKYKDQLKFFKYNISKQKDLVAKYNLEKYPTILIIKDGQVVAKEVGCSSDFKDHVEAGILKAIK